MRTIPPITFAEPKQNATQKSDFSLLVENIKTNEKNACQFFYAKTKDGLSIAPIRSRIISQIYESYQIVIQPYVFSTVLYEYLWDEGTWKPLNTCPRNNAFFPWLRTVAFRAVLKHLEEDELIKVQKARTVANTRLDLSNKPKAYCDAVINDLVADAEMRSFLKAVYVDNLDELDVQKRLGLTDEDFKCLSFKSEVTLKKALINGLHHYNDALVDLNQRKINLSFDDCVGIDNVAESSDELSLIYDILDIKFGDPDAKQKVDDFLYEFSNNLPWKAEDKFVWQSRFIKEMSPVEVVKSLPTKRSRAWLDTRYSRLNSKFHDAINKWWYEKTVLAA